MPAVVNTGWKVPQGFCGGALKVNGWQQVPKDGRRRDEGREKNESREGGN